MGKRKILLFGLCMLLLVGCGDEDDKLNSAFNSFIEKSVMGSSNIENEESYKRYEEISSKESVSAEGYYYSDDVDYNVLEDTDAIHVTFATNSFIDVMVITNMVKGLNPELPNLVVEVEFVD